MRPRLQHVALLALALAGALATWLWLRHSERAPDAPPPAPPTPARYVDSKVCGECHAEEMRRWQGSDHDRAWEPAVAGSVLGDFDDAEVTVHGVTTRFTRRDGRYFVRTEDVAGAPQELEVKGVFGIDPLQQLLVELPRGRVQCIPLAWATKERRWFHLYAEPIRPDDPLHWTGPLQNWNFMCAECHATGLKRGYDATTDTYATTWHEMDVGCQSCHGPGESHVAWARQKAAGAGAAQPSKGLHVQLKGVPAALEIDACARCHARRSQVDAEDVPGAPFLDHYDLQLLTEPHYHADGQIQDEVYEVGSFLQAKKQRHGVRCSDCHDPHSAGLKAVGNALCVRCHSPTGDVRFPTLPLKRYDTPEHTHHALGTPGSGCVDCHMPPTTYMGVDPRRDHGFRIPRPDLTLSIGTPNACDRCHAKEGPAWAAAALERWFPRPADAPRPAHWAQAMAASRDGHAGASAGLAALVHDREQNAIVRATALRRLEATPGPEARAAIEAGLRDPDGLVRAAAVRLVGELLPRAAAPQAQAQKVLLLAPLLDDPLRLVRVEAARALSEVEPALLPSERRAAYDRALAEHERRQLQLFDRSDGPFNLAVLRENQGRLEEAEALYGRALAHDAHFAPALVNRATLRSRLGRLAEAEADLRQALVRTPEAGEVWYSLGLLLAERGRMEEAAAALARAAGLLPRNARVRLNLALAQRGLGRLPEAALALEEALRLAPDERDAAVALVEVWIEQGDLERAEALARGLAERAPQLRGLLERVRARRTR